MKSVRIMGFDLDGTLVKMKLDLKQVRKDLGIPHGDTLAYISSLPDKERNRYLDTIKEREMSAAESAEPMEGARELLDYCRSKDIKIVVITRNSEEPTKRTLDKLGLAVDNVVSREHAAPKPSPEPINLILSHYKVKPHEMAFVGDYLYDMQAGRAAGVKTILITTQENADEWASCADFVVCDLYEVLDLLREGSEVGSHAKGCG